MSSWKIIGFVMIASFALGAVARADEKDMLTYCKADVERLCAGIAPGGGRLIKCLKEHKEEMSVGCAQALMKLKGK